LPRKSEVLVLTRSGLCSSFAWIQFPNMVSLLQTRYTSNCAGSTPFHKTFTWLWWYPLQGQTRLVKPT